MTTKKIIYGIQQVGVGVTDAKEAFRWYAKHLGADLLVFDDHNVAKDMARYMGGQSRAKHAILAMNHNGGGGFEIWQYSDRAPKASNFNILLGFYRPKGRVTKNVSQPSTWRCPTVVKSFSFPHIY